MQLYFGELVDKGRFKYYCAGEHCAAGAERPPASAQSSHKIQCGLTNRFCDTQLRTSAYQMMVSIIFGSNDVDYLKDWTLRSIPGPSEEWSAAVGAYRESRSTIKYGLKVTECCSTHARFRFIWKQARNVSGTNKSMGGKLGKTSSGTISTSMLHGIFASIRTSKSKGMYEEYFQHLFGRTVL